MGMFVLFMLFGAYNCISMIQGHQQENKIQVD